MIVTTILKKLRASLNSPIGPHAARLEFRCNVCGRLAKIAVGELGREIVSCHLCGSTVRGRAVTRLLSLGLFKRSLSIDEFPMRRDLAVLDMSGWQEFGRRVGGRLGYLNTYFHQEPRLDITSVDPSWHGRFDVVISSDVFEHVIPPVSVAFENTLKLLKPGGLFVLTVPYRKQGDTVEHFPDLHRFEVAEDDGGWHLRNTTRDGQEQIFNNLVFHGGPGSTLEMRVFSESGVRKELEWAGFQEIQFHNEAAFDDGIYWTHDWSLPITARNSL